MRVILMFVFVVMSSATVADQSVKGYFKKDGTYVPPHYRTDPDSRRDNNWSSRDNTNPYTGKRGTVNPYTPPPIRRPR